MDLGIDLMRERRVRVTQPAGTSMTYGDPVQHMFTGIELTDKGHRHDGRLRGGGARDVGMDIPLSADHFGHIGVNSCIRLGKALRSTTWPGSKT